MIELDHNCGRSGVPEALRAIVGRSDWAEQVRAVITGVAPYPSSVMISGGSGTGKELIARAIHAVSPRADKRFIPVDCAAITGTLFASHMFGHLKGAFTGASYAALGCFRAAEGGTIFLDEIGELELELQAKLLRVVQERVVVPVGSHDGLPVNVRIIAATNRDLQREVAAGRFREDLYYRLNVVAIQTLPLGQRPEDIDVLAEHFLGRFAVENGMSPKRLSPAARESMHRYPWPGNVRELENALERAILFTPGELIGPEVIPQVPARAAGQVVSGQELPSSTICVSGDEPAAAVSPVSPQSSKDGRWLTAAEIECEHIRRTLEHTGYNQSAAARLLGIDRHLLRRRIISHGLDVSRSQQGRPPLRFSPLRRAA
jgi:DNA-binding NtrC family response regulator